MLVQAAGRGHAAASRHDTSRLMDRCRQNVCWCSWSVWGSGRVDGWAHYRQSVSMGADGAFTAAIMGDQ